MNKRALLAALSTISLLIALVFYWGLPYYAVACALLGPAVAAYVFLMAKILSLRPTTRILFGVWIVVLALQLSAEVVVRISSTPSITASAGAMPRAVARFNAWRNARIAQPDASAASNASMDPDQQALAALKTLVIADECNRQNVAMLVKDTGWNRVLADEFTRNVDDIRDGKEALARYRKLRSDLVDHMTRTLAQGRAIITGMSEYGQPSVMSRFMEAQNVRISAEKNDDERMAPILINEDGLLDLALTDRGATRAPGVKPNGSGGAKEIERRREALTRDLNFVVKDFNQSGGIEDLYRRGSNNEFAALLGIPHFGQPLDSSICPRAQSSPRRPRA